MNELKKNLPATVITILILVVGSWYLFSNSMNTYPAYVHAWTQTDRLALAENFQENGFDFFHPATYNLLTKDGVTQVDFPIHDYLVALISEGLNIKLVSTFRWYTLIYSLIGLFFFFRLTLLFTQSAARSVLGTSFLFTLPFFVYYQNGFLPSAPSFANFIIGFYFICRARNNQSLKKHVLGVVFIALAALARAPFFIFLFALFLQQLWQNSKQKKFELSKIFIQLTAIGVFIAYWFYNQHLGKVYGSMFLSEPLYFKSFSNFIEIISTAANRWGDQLLSPFHGALFVALLIYGIVQLKKKGFVSKQNVSLFHYISISAIGVLLFFFAFGRQFADHDYYYIDSFLPLLALLMIYLLSKLKLTGKWYTYTGTISIIFFFYFFSYAKESQLTRYTPPYNDRVEYAYQVYERAKEDLKTWGVKPTDTLFVLEANSTNIPFTVFKNKGFASLSSSERVVSNELDSSFTYAVLIDSFFVESSFRAYPNLIKRLEKVNSNGELSLYRKSKTGDPSKFFDELIYYGFSDFDERSNLKETATAWTSTIQIDSLHNNSLKIEGKNEYTITINDSLKKILPQKDIRLHMVGDFYQEDSSKIQVVCQINDYYGVRYTINELKKIKQWERKQFRFKIPSSHFKEGDKLNFYFWNPDKSELIVDNLNLIIFQ